tara:strand:- start:1207 stop:2427 length:1221 start_codon:yes stop_codon:yes gene_type:complete
MFKNIIPAKFQSINYSWPIQEKNIANKLKSYYLDYKNGKNGLPDSIENLEKDFCKFNKSKYSLALSSCTAALHIAYLSLGIKKDDEVIISNYTFPATAIPLFLIGAKPILCDVDREDANIDVNEIEKLITKKTKAITVTHWWGQPCNMEKICKITKKYKLKLIEDCAHAPGAKYKNKLVGTFGDFGCFSFDNNKLLAAGEGGILVTNNYKYYQKAILLSDFGPRLYKSIKLPNFKNFIETGLGTKYRIHFLAAKIAIIKLKKINQLNLERKRVFDYFSKKLKSSKLLIAPKNKLFFTRGGFYGYKVLMKKNKYLDVKKFILILKSKKVDARRTVTPPLHLTKTFKNGNIKNFFKNYSFKYNSNNLKNSEWFHKNHISFPSFYKKEHEKIIDEYIRIILSVEKLLKI